MTPTRRVLIVDDDESIREFVSWALSEDGYEVGIAQDGAAALALIEKWTPDVILLDMRMPTMNGWEFSKRYRELYLSRAPIIVLTAARDATSSAREIGAEAYLSKPFDLEELLALVERFRQDR